jgi:hypothetical protein
VNIDVLDLTDEKTDINQILKKQREEAVKAQQEREEKPTFNSFNCVICMDTPTDLTATKCGKCPLTRRPRS